MTPATAHALDRRSFLRASAAAGGGLLLTAYAPAARTSASAATPAQDPEFEPNAWLRIAPSGAVTVMINKAEMGQGVSTSLSMLAAEELDADWKDVGFEFAPAAPAYNHPGMPIQFTGGSTSVAGMSETLRKAGASARLMLVAAAANAWGVPASECTTRASVVSHAASNRRARYGSLVDAAARTSELPKNVVLKEPRDFRLLGHSTKRLDTPAKATGTAQFSLDVVRPGMLTALVAHPPVFGGKVKSFDDSAAKRIAGVRHVFAVASGVAVVADGFWAAKRGRDALKVTWDDGPNASFSTEALRAQYRALARGPGLVARHDGDADKAFAAAAKRIEADYEFPFLAHAPMEPLNCVVELTGETCDIWAGSQFQTIDHAAAARVAGLAPERVKLHTTFMGGGFGRRANPTSDYIVEAVQIAAELVRRVARVPVKLVWTREDDTRGGYYRPQFHSRLEAGLDGNGEITAWSHTLVGQSFIAGTPFESFIIKDGIDETSVEGAKDLPYGVPNVRVSLHTTQVPVPTLWWRSVGHTHTAFAVECFLDEVSRATRFDPVAFRRKLLANEPRTLAVLDAAWRAASKSPLPAGRARGVAAHFSFNTHVAHVVEASIEHGVPRVHRVWCAIDCGRVVNPDGVVAQLEGAVGFALTAALYSEITLVNGRVEQSNFHDYRMLRIHEMPEVEVVIVPSDAPSTGVGEPGVPTVAPALCNALFQLTGRPIRRLPIRPEDLRA